MALTNIRQIPGGFQARIASLIASDKGKSPSPAAKGDWPIRADDLKHRCTFPRGLGSASEAHCPARLGPGGAFLL
jgi:hypothetical protein